MPSGVNTLSSPTRPASAPSASGLPRAMTRSLRAGALAAIGTWAIVVVPALIGWVSSPESTVGWFSAVSVGSAIWFLGHAQSIGGPTLSISVAPILLLLIFVLLARRTARRLLATERAQVRAADWGPVIVRNIVPGFTLGYLAVASVAALFTLGGPVGPGAAAVLGSLIVPLAGLGACLLRPGIMDPWEPVRRLFERGPEWLARAWSIGWRGAWLLLGLGLGLVVLRLLGMLGPVLDIHGQYDLDPVAGFALVLTQLAFFGNLATWGLSFLAGPGFSVAVGATISPAAAHPGMMPLIPVLGGLPDEATYPWMMWLVLIVPVLAGAAIARWVDRDADETPSRDRFLAAAVACAIAVTVVGVLIALGNGSIGGERLSDIGPSVGPVVGALLVETLIGATAWIGFRMLEQHRGPIGRWVRAGGVTESSDTESSDTESSVVGAQAGIEHALHAQ